jgi:hypothetical protein
MQFSVPSATSMEQALTVYNGVKKYLNSKGFHPHYTAIAKIEYVHNGNAGIAEVNHVTRINDEIVVLIFECDGLFLICTPSRGVAGGDPIIVLKTEMIQVVYFDDLQL